MKRFENELIVRAAALSVILAIGIPTIAGAQPLTPSMAPLGFLVGTWTGLSGGRTVNGNEPRGSFRIESAAGGAALLRRDHTELVGHDGKRAQTFEQVMLIYPEDGRIRAEYFDGMHTIHYTAATIEPGQSVKFTTTPRKHSPTFSLTYRKLAADTVSIKFEAADAGDATFHVIAEGAAKKE